MQTRSKKNEIAVIGELNADLVVAGLNHDVVFGQEVLADDFQVLLGSASAIFACGIARLGHGVTFVSRVGNDNVGKFCREELEKCGISAEFVKIADGSKTGITVVLSSPHDRALVTVPGAISELEFADVPLDVLDGHRHLHLTSYFLQTGLRHDIPRLMREARKRGLTVSFDPNSDPTLKWDDGIEDAIIQTDILFLNESEAKQLTSKPDAEAAARKLAEICPCVVVKCGAKGSFAIKNGDFVAADGFETTAVDTVGAGDSFDAGFIHAFLADKDLHECLRSGNGCGAFSVTRSGGTSAQPDRKQLQKLLAQYDQATKAAGHQVK